MDSAMSKAVTCGCSSAGLSFVLSSGAGFFWRFLICSSFVARSFFTFASSLRSWATSSSGSVLTAPWAFGAVFSSLLSSAGLVISSLSFLACSAVRTTCPLSSVGRESTASAAVEQVLDSLQRLLQESRSWIAIIISHGSHW